MYNLRARDRESFVIQVRGEEGEEGQGWHIPPAARVSPRLNLNLSAMKLFNRFRKIFMRLILSFPSRSSSAASAVKRQRPAGDGPDPPKTSCSSYHYSPNSHYPEAIADCIEFFNKSFQEEISRKSDAQV